MEVHWFARGTPVSSINKTDRCDITEIMLKVALNTITLTLQQQEQLLNTMAINKYNLKLCGCLKFPKPVVVVGI